MSCPIHIWVPLMGAAAPFARVAQTKVRALLARPEPEPEAPRELKRWAPVGQAQTDTADQPS